MKNIRNLFRISLLSFLVGCCTGGVLQEKLPPLPSSSQNLSKVGVEKLRQSTVAVVSNTLGIVVPSCAGVWIDIDLILTAAHCVDDVDNPFALVSTIDDFEKGNCRPGDVIAVNNENDLALIRLEPKNIPPHPIVRLAEKSVAVGDAVHVMGHPVGFTWTYSYGYIAAVRENLLGPGGKNFKKSLQISAPVWMGNSGGGAFDSEGKLVGISSWVSKAGPHLSFFVHSEIIESFIMQEIVKEDQ